MCGGPRPPRGVEGTSGLDTQWSCRCLVPAESRGAFSVTGQAASVCSPPDQYHCKQVLGPGSEMPPCARPSRAAWLPPPPAPTSTPSPMPENLSPSASLRRPSRGLPASAAATPRCQEALVPPGCPSCPRLGPALAPLLPPGTSWTEGQSPGEGGPVLSAPRWATEAAEAHPRQRCLGNLPDELRGLSIPLWRILESRSPPSHHQEPYLCCWPFKS